MKKDLILQDLEKKMNHTPFVYDKTLRELLKNLPQKFIEILSGKRGVRFIDTTLPKVKERRPDLVVELEDGSVFHLEVQTKHDVNMDFRMIDYYVALKQLDEVRDRELLQMVLYLGEKGEKDRSGKKEVVFDNGKLRFTYDVRYISDIECRPLIESESIDDNILSVLCKMDDFSYFWERLKEKILKFPISKRRDYLTKLVNLSRLRPDIFKIITMDLKKEVEDMPLIIDKEKDPLYKEGIEIGIKEGLIKGKEEALKEGIKLALEIKFGGEGLMFYNRYVDKMEGVDELEKIKERIRTAKSVDELLGE